MRIQSVSIIVLLLLTLFSCNSKQIKQPKCPLITPEIYERDKRQVADCIMRNIEYIRANYCDSIQYTDIANFYMPYVEFYHGDRDYYVSAPIPSSDYVKVTVDTIIYDTSGVKCFVFFVIEKKTVVVDGFKSREDGRNFDANALVGIRKQVADSLCLYPFVKFKTFGFESYQSAIKELKRLYFNHLKGDCIAGSVYKNRRFDYNVGEQGFFESVIYQKCTDSTYYYQYNGNDLMQYHYLK